MATNTLILNGSKAPRVRRNPRGVFEKHPGSGEWWICYWDAQARKRREKAGTKSNAIDLYRKRKNEALQGKKLLEKLRRATVTFADIAKDALTYSKAPKSTYADDEQRMKRLLERFRSYPADAITPADIEGFLEEGSDYVRTVGGIESRPRSTTSGHYSHLRTGWPFATAKL